MPGPDVPSPYAPSGAGRLFTPEWHRSIRAAEEARCRMLAISAERLDRSGVQFREAWRVARAVAERHP